MAVLGFRQTGFWRDEITLFTHTLDLTGTNSLIRFNLAVAYQKAGRPADAEREYRRTLAEDPAYLPAYNGLGSLLFDAGRREEAVDVLAAGIGRGRGSHRLHFILGLRLQEMGRPAEAVAHFEEALRLRPDFADAHLALGIVRAGEGRLDEAERHFRAALAAEPASEAARENLRLLAEMRRERAGAPGR